MSPIPPNHESNHENLKLLAAFSALFSDADEEFLFSEKEDSPIDEKRKKNKTWKVLVVDDDESVHHVTKLVLSHFEFDGKKLEIMHALSGIEAQKKLTEHDDIALVLLDVIMETEHAGLDVVNYVRQKLNNKKIRILLRTGQPGAGSHSENQLIRKFAFNDFRNKAELSSHELKTAVIAMLRAYEELSSEWHALPDWAEKESNTWKILVADDESEVIRLTELFLQHFEFENKKIEFHHAESILEAQKILKENPDMNLLILDLAFAEGELAGITLADTIRSEFGNYLIQILIRTGRGDSERKPVMIQEHLINDYRTKTELPSIRFDTVICALLRTYQDLIEAHKKGSSEALAKTS